MTKKLSTVLLALLTIFISGLVSKAQAATAQEIKDIIVKTAISMGVDPCVALSIAKHESNFEHKNSTTGPVGVFQLMPSTARRLGFDPYSVDENVKAGITYYQMMYKKYGSMDLALAAYNAGPGNVAKYNGIPPFRETKIFIDGIKSNYKMFQDDPTVLKHSAVKDKITSAPKQEEKKNETPVDTENKATAPKQEEVKEEKSETITANAKEKTKTSFMKKLKSRINTIEDTL